MKIHSTSLQGVLLIEPQIFRDPRGFFQELYNRELYQQHGVTEEFVQDNRAVSTRATIHHIGEGLAQYMTYFDDAGLINQEVEKYLEVTPGEMRAAAETFLIPDNRTTIIVETGPSAGDPAALS